MTDICTHNCEWCEGRGEFSSIAGDDVAYCSHCNGSGYNLNTRSNTVQGDDAIRRDAGCIQTDGHLCGGRTDGYGGYTCVICQKVYTSGEHVKETEKTLQVYAIQQAIEALKVAKCVTPTYTHAQTYDTAITALRSHNPLAFLDTPEAVGEVGRAIQCLFMENESANSSPTIEKTAKAAIAAVKKMGGV